MNEFPDIYFTPEYCRLNERHEGGVFESFTHKGDRGEVCFQFIRRPLDKFEGFSEYSDIITPYGYGGPFFRSADDADKQQLAAEFGRAFSEFCRDTKIVSAFVRFHPLLGNAPDFNSVFDEVTLIRNTVAIDLSKDIFHEEFERTIRKSYNKAKERGLSIKFDPELETLDKFVSLYYSLMDSKNTSDYYFFPREYFSDLKKLEGNVELVSAELDGETISSVMFFKYGIFVHAHLTGSTPAGNDNRAVEVIKASMALRAKAEGYRWNHLGGGFSNDPHDTLLRFKRKFSKEPLLDFYIGKNICDRAVYKKLCAAAGQDEDSDDGFFPKYRV